MLFWCYGMWEAGNEYVYAVLVIVWCGVVCVICCGVLRCEV